MLGPGTGQELAQQQRQAERSNKALVMGHRRQQ